jgi:hypothetical protein
VIPAPTLDLSAESIDMLPSVGLGGSVAFGGRCLDSWHALGFCITPIPYCVQRFLGFVKAGEMP